ncbi:TBC1 domain family member 10B [Merluccius polli]|uniref:TBC1 domain family member 10B n=1 Tax=Merluccius polli TaxID=89951 RepID=A0AA47N7L3_MERPO|nr:TBC1 domain family member 10B [Merluccius polli]
MAEISTLTPSTPGLGDPPAAPSILPPSTALPDPSSPTKEAPPTNPKSFLYHEKPLKDPTATPLPAGAPAPAEAVSAGVPVHLTAVGTALQSDGLGVAEVPQVGVNPVPVMKQDGGVPANLDSTGTMPSIPNEQSEPSAIQAAQQPSPPSPDVNPTPNLYPSVHVAQNPNPAIGDAQAAPKQALVPAPLQPASPPPDSTLTPGETAVASAQEKPPQSPPPPVPPKPNSGTWSPKYHSPTSMERVESPPATPFKAEHPPFPLPVIQEPAGLYLPPVTPKARPAPDTLSYLESASLMSGTLESLSGLGEDGSSVGSDSEINGVTARRIDKYGFLGGNQYSESGDKDIRVEVARQREMKWLDMFSNWDKWVKHRFQKVKIRCRKGIPSSLRSRAWQLLSNSQDLLDANPGKFEELEREPGEAKWLDIIEKDLHRQFPFHEMFAARGGHGQQDLYRILKAYTIYRPDEGYCQAQAPVAAVLLMHMPAEQAFWCLVQICERYLPGYYSAGLEAIQLDGEIFFSLLRRTCPMAYRHLKKFKIDPILYMTEWFMCIFSRTLPWSCVLRVWDMFFCEGVKIVFRVGLVLLKQTLGSVDKLRELQGMYETMERLRNITPDLLREDVLVQEIVVLPVTESLIERECNIQVRKWRESRGELTHQPGRRLNGTRAIHEQKRRASAISSGGSFSFLGSSVPPPGPLRASSSLLSLPGFRRSKAPFHSQTKKGSFSGPSGSDALPPLHRPPVASPVRGPAHKPPLPVAAAPRVVAPHIQSPLVGTESPTAQPPQQPAAPEASAQAHQAASSPNQSTSHNPPHQPTLPPATLTPSPLVVSEQVTPTIPSPMANNAPLLAFPPEAAKESTAAAAEEMGEGGKKKKRSKEDKRKEKEDEKQKMKEKKDREKTEKERLRKEKERQEKDKKKEKLGKKKDKGAGAEASERNGGGATKDSA